MTTLKEKIVEASRNSKLVKAIEICVVIAIALIAVMSFFKVIEVLIRITAIIGSIFIFALAVTNAINDADEEVIQKNKLIYILLSDEYVVWPIIWLIAYLLLFGIVITGEVGVFIQVIVVIALLVVTKKITKIINNYFKSKLSR